MLEAAYLALGKIAPDWQQLELHVGGATVASAVSEATGVTRCAVHTCPAAHDQGARSNALQVVALHTSLPGLQTLPLREVPCCPDVA